MQVSLKTITKNKNIAKVRSRTTPISNVKIEIRHGVGIFINEQCFEPETDPDPVAQKESVVNFATGGKQISVKTIFNKETDKKIVFEVDSCRTISSVTVNTPMETEAEGEMNSVNGDSLVWLRRGLRIYVRTLSGKNTLILDYIFGF